MKDDFLDAPTGGGNVPARRKEQSTELKQYESPAIQTARLLHDSNLFPGARSVAGVFTIVQFGKEVGLSPVVALNNINIIKGKIAMSGQSMLALATRHGVKAEFEVETNKECTVLFTREGYGQYRSTFTMDDAKEAGLLDLETDEKKATCGQIAREAWRKYKKTMLKWRAVVQGLRVIAADILAGIYTQEEIENIEESAQNDTPVDQNFEKICDDSNDTKNTTGKDTVTASPEPARAPDKAPEQTSGQSQPDAKPVDNKPSDKATPPQIKKFNVMATQSGLRHFSHPLKKWLVNVDGSGLSGNQPSGKDLNKDFCSKLISSFEKFSTLFFASPSNREAIAYIFTTLKDDDKRKVLKTISSYVNDLSSMKDINIDKADREMLANYLSLFLVALENQEHNRIAGGVDKEGLTVEQVLATLRELGFKPEVREQIDISKGKEAKDGTKAGDTTGNEFDF